MRRSVTIKSQLMISFLGVMIFPILIIGSIATYSSKETIKQEMTHYSSRMSSILTENINHFTAEIEKEFDNYMLDKEFAKNVKSSGENPDSVELINGLSKRLEKSVISNQYIQAVIFITGDKKIVTGDLKGISSSVYDKKNLEENGLVEDLEEKSGSTIWTYNFGGNKKLTAFRIIHAGIGEAPLGILVFEINKESFEKRMFGSEDDKSQIQMILTTAEGEVILPQTDNEEATYLMDIYPQLFDEAKDYELSNLHTPISTRKNFIIYDACNGEEWRLIMATPLSSMMKEVNKIGVKIIFITCVLVIVAVFISILIATSISKPIRNISEAMDVASKGDLTVVPKIRGSKEIMKLNESLILMLKNISELLIQNKEVIHTVRENAEFVKESANLTKECSKEINFAIEDIVNGATKQNEEVLKTNDEMGALSGGIDMILGKMGEVGHLMQQSTKESETAQKAVEVLNNKTLHAAEKMEGIHSNISELKEMSGQIIEIVTVINQMSDTINLLSLNASIEAARAGNAGRGFAVVAGEVRKLAFESKNSTQMIRNMIEAIQTKTEDTVKVAMEVDAVFNEQKQSVNAAGKTFNGLIQTIERLYELMKHLDKFIGDIHANKDSVLASSNHIHILVEHLMAATEELLSNSNLQNESASHMNYSSNELLGNMNELEACINKFKLES